MERCRAATAWMLTGGTELCAEPVPGRDYSQIIPTLGKPGHEENPHLDVFCPGFFLGGAKQGVIKHPLVTWCQIPQLEASLGEGMSQLSCGLGSEGQDLKRFPLPLSCVHSPCTLGFTTCLPHICPKASILFINWFNSFWDGMKCSIGWP